jgi:16S rRNA C967 or C1407 C5-methylase (RsmB/RsmF family)
VKNVEVKKMNSTKAEEIFGFEVFDKVLLDAPCTGLGQRPRLSYARVNIKQTAGYSRALLVSACRVLKVSGLLLYSTCSISDEGNFSLENDENIAWALQHLPLTLLEQPFYLGEKGLAGLTQTIPAMTDSGFFIALLRKTSTIEHL